jgi:hypothetical protein
MPYWGSDAIDNDYAFDSIGAYIYLIKERMLEDADHVIEKPIQNRASSHRLSACVCWLASSRNV